MSREPWIKLKIGTRRSGKVACLPSDSARLGYIYLLLEAKVQREMGVFEGRAHFAEVLGRFGRYLPHYLAGGLLHEAPALCADCRARHPAVRPGAIVVHDYLREQRDPTNADRQDRWRDNAASNADRNGTDNAPLTPTVTPHSRARGTTATATVTERGLPTTLDVVRPLAAAGEPR